MNLSSCCASGSTLYTLPNVAPHLTAQRKRGIHIRAAHPTEGQVVAMWVREHFSEGWVPTAVSAMRQPSSCFLAVKIDPRHTPQQAYNLLVQRLLGFACYSSDVKGMFGPTGVREDRRGRGTATTLLLALPHTMRRNV